MLKRSYLIYERNAPEQLPVFLAFSVRELAEWLGVTKRHAFRLLRGECSHPQYDIFVDEFDPTEEEGQYTATTAPSYHLSQRFCNES